VPKSAKKSAPRTQTHRDIHTAYTIYVPIPPHAPQAVFLFVKEKKRGEKKSAVASERA